VDERVPFYLATRRHSTCICSAGRTGTGGRGRLRCLPSLCLLFITVHGCWTCLPFSAALPTATRSPRPPVPLCWACLHGASRRLLISLRLVCVYNRSAGMDACLCGNCSRWLLLYPPFRRTQRVLCGRRFGHGAAQRRRTLPGALFKLQDGRPPGHRRPCGDVGGRCVAAPASSASSSRENGGAPAAVNGRHAFAPDGAERSSSACPSTLPANSCGKRCATGTEEGGVLVYRSSLEVSSSLLLRHLPCHYLPPRLPSLPLRCASSHLHAFLLKRSRTGC